MLRTDLVDLVNSGAMWAFLGAGVSANAGLPPWRELVERILDSTGSDVKARLLADTRYLKAFKGRTYEVCLSRIGAFTGRAEPIRLVQENLVVQPGRDAFLLRLLADWPFAGYITTNYDLLMEDELRRSKQSAGWP